MIGESIGNFVVIRKLGQGGMGEVLLAEHKEIKTQVAIKVLLPQISAEKQHVERFFNEAVAVSKIKHSGIAKIFDVGFHTKGEAYLVMEFLDGESLADRISRLERLPYEQVFDIGRQIASVLEATHAAGITHRDLKPDNIFTIPDAELASGERVKVLDFGIAKLGSSKLTQTNGTMGTPTYMSPEQWMSTAKVDGRADAYSLGCILFEMACGRPPFVTESLGELCASHLTEIPPTTRSIAPDAPAAFDALVVRLLAKDAQERPTVREAKDALSQLAIELGVAPSETKRTPAVRWDTPTDGVIASARPTTTLGASAMPLPTLPPARSRSRSKWLVLGGIGAVAAAGLTFAIVSMAGSRDPEPAAAPASLPSSVAAPGPAVPAPAAPAAAAVPAPPAIGASVELQIKTVPPTAQVTIDDAVVGNPFTGKFSRSDVRHRIDVRAEGYKPDSRWVTFEGDHVLEIELVKDTSVTAPAVVTTTPPRTTTTRTAPTRTTSTRTSAASTKPATTSAVATTPATTTAATKAEPPKTETPAKQPEGKATYRGSKATISTDFPTD